MSTLPSGEPSVKDQIAMLSSHSPFIATPIRMPASVSWWIQAQREGFTALCYSQLCRMRTSMFGRPVTTVLE